MPDASVIFAYDKASARSRDADGRMRVKDCVLSTAEVNPYYGREIPGWDQLGLDPNRIYELYRDPVELEKGAPTFSANPIMVKHIPQTADDPKKEWIGGAIDNIRFVGNKLRGDLLMWDGKAIDLVESEEQADLSCGYRYKPDMTPRTVNGRRVDGTMRDIQGNHVALVDDGRASGAHVADRAMQNPQAPEPTNHGDASMNENDNPGQPGAAPAPAAAPAAQPVTAAPAEPQAGMAEVGAALKSIATVLQTMQTQMAAMAGQNAEPAAAPAPGAGAGDAPHAAAAVDGDPTENGDPNRDATQGATDFALEEGPKEGAFDEDIDESEGNDPAMADDNDIDEDGNVTIPNQAAQEGTPARGGKTLTPVASPTGAMDAASIRKHTNTAVSQAIAAERARAAAIAQAERDVRPVIGEVYGMDNAGAIYRAALAAQGVDTKLIPKGGAKAAWNMYMAGKGASGASPRASAAMAMDSTAVSATVTDLSAKLGRIRNLG
jgi:hypothetical protein